MNYDTLFELYGFIEGQVADNDRGEHVLVSIDEHKAVIRTFQHNGWIRYNIYYKDGSEEELYDRQLFKVLRVYPSKALNHYGGLFMIYYIVIYMKDGNIHLKPHDCKDDAEHTIEQLKDSKWFDQIDLIKIVKRDSESSWFKGLKGYWI